MCQGVHEQHTGAIINGKLTTRRPLVQVAFLEMSLLQLMRRFSTSVLRIDCRKVKGTEFETMLVRAMTQKQLVLRFVAAASQL